MFRRGEHFSEFIAARERGERCEVDGAMYDYFLELLPPRFMFRTVTLSDGSIVYAEFGFGEGEERTTAFWKRGERYFAQQVLGRASTASRH